ncbi:unnamed protein product [Gongylonema pulchrum]|uniref:Isochorismatase domain-containing protein 1 n=1 Tax=Gongylonema pulchrum TaxID=637853 RepID=A0A183CU94_9BILA|nr:unnamed protein product [Gongylonema pulchrum]
MSPAISRLSPSNTVLLLCDLQEKFRPTIKYFDAIVKVSKRLIDAANLFEMKIIATEQSPKDLGHSVSELELAKHNVQVFEKTNFSMCIPPVIEALGSAKSVILCGIETHVCILHTAFDLLEKGINVHMERAGAVLTTSECAILSLLGSSDHPKYPEVQKMK